MSAILLRILMLGLPALAALAGARLGGAAAALGASALALFLHDLVRRHVVERTAAPEPRASWREWLDPTETAARGIDELRRDFDRLASRDRRYTERLGALARLQGTSPADGELSGILCAVRDYCVSSGLTDGFALFTLGAGRDEVLGEWAFEDADRGAWKVKTTRLSRSGIGGALARCLDTARGPVTAVEPGELLTVNGSRLPMIPELPARVLAIRSPRPAEACFDEGWLHSRRCPSFEPDPAAQIRSVRGSGAEAAWARCAQCESYPLHGALVVFGAEGVGVGDEGLDDLEILARTLGGLFERIALERRSRTADRLRSQILDAMLNGLMSTDQRGRVVYANAAARELVAPADPVGRPLEEFVDLPGGSAAVTRALMEGRATLQAQGLLRRAPREDGPANLPVEVNLTPLRPQEGGVKGAVCVIADRSQVRAMRDEIRHLDTLAAIGRFASSLAHEIRNPLGGIQAGVEFLARDPSLQTEHRENLGVIEGEVRRLESILKNLLSVARPREMVIAPCDPVDLATRVLRSFRELAEAVDVKLELRAPQTSEALHGDHEMIHQVLLNLVKNAIEATPSGGRVQVVVHPVDPRDASRARARFEVLDDGPGIAEADLPHLFEPFFSRKSEGTGLGLYVCHGFVQRHGGQLRVENRPEGGARFLLDLPRIPALLGGSHATSHSRSG